MKLFLALLLVSNIAFALPTPGNYRFKKAVCPEGKVLDLGWKFIDIDIWLNVLNDKEWNQKVVASSVRGLAPFKLHCTVNHKGSFQTYSTGKIMGNQKQQACKCQESKWNARYCVDNTIPNGRHGDTIISYKQSGNTLMISYDEGDPNTDKKSCKDGKSAIYYYVK